VVEIKSFLSESMPNEFHTALGQYLDYELGLEEQEPNRIIFLAIPDKIYHKIEKIPLLMKAINHYNLNIIVFDPITEIIEQWLKK
jgi:hypothetical protein